MEKGEQVHKPHHNYLVLLLVAAVSLAAILTFQTDGELGSPATGKAGEPGMAAIAVLASSAQPRVGDILMVTVMIDNVMNLYGYQFDLSYNPAVLRFESTTKGPFLSNNNVDQTYFSLPLSTPGLLDNTAESRTGPSPAGGTSGALTVFQFTVIGSGVSALHLSEVMLSDPETNAIPFTIIDGSISAIQCIDADGDTYGQYCTAGPDCDDGNAAINPGAAEIPYDGMDNDCNSLTLENDLDGDSYAVPADCNDNDPNVNPGKAEVPYDGIDNDCNPSTKDNDLDGDGYDVPADCNDNDAAIHPGAVEVPYDGIDNDCSDTPDNDLDGDGYTVPADCNDNNPLVNPGRAEVTYNGVDDDCNAATKDDDLDADGYLQANDCNDANANINPGAAEIPYNSIDDNCNGQVDEGCPPEDVNHDLVVDIFDMVAVSSQIGTTNTDPSWNPVLDLKPDNAINIFDLVKVGRAFGMSC